VHLERKISGAAFLLLVIFTYLLVDAFGKAKSGCFAGWERINLIKFKAIMVLNSVSLGYSMVV
jgi:hypothetical protein